MSVCVVRVNDGVTVFGLVIVHFPCGFDSTGTETPFKGPTCFYSETVISSLCFFIQLCNCLETIVDNSQVFD